MQVVEVKYIVLNEDNISSKRGMMPFNDMINSIDTYLPENL